MTQGIQYGHSYDIKGGPDVETLLATLNTPDNRVTFTFVGYVDGELVEQDIDVKVNSAKPVDADQIVFIVGGEVITENGFDERTTIRRYNARDKVGTGAGVFL